jgi:type IV pilus assembly protein PilE
MVAQTCTCRTGRSGFTLVEMMIAVAVLAILAAVALPIYERYSNRAYRSEAMADLLDCAQALERRASVSFSYGGAADDGTDAGTIDPNICPSNSVTQNRYAITYAGDDATFALTAAPVGGVDEGRQISLNSAGVRGWDEDIPANGIDADEMDWEES